MGNKGESDKTQGVGNLISSEVSRVLIKAKQKTFEVGLSQGLNLLSKTPESSYARITDKIFSPFAEDSSQKAMTADWIHDFLSSSEGASYVGRTLRSLHPNVRKIYLTKFISSLLFRDPVEAQKIEETREKMGAAPKLMVISPTSKCNLKCTGCYAGEYEKKELSQQEVQSVIDQGKDLGVRFFVISGGEPFLYKPLFDILKANKDSVFQLYTNGTLIDKDAAKKLVKLGNACPCICVEGFEEETDGRRGKGVYNKVLEAFDNLHEAGAMYGFSATATRENFRTITSDEFIDKMVDKGVHYGWYFMFMPVGSDTDAINRLFLTPEDRNEFRDNVSSIRKKKKMLVGDFWNDGCLTNGCLAAGRHYLHITSEGNIEPCVFTHFSTHNIRENTLLEALEAPFFTQIRSELEQDYKDDPNPLRPCTIIDRPYILRDAVVENSARADHKGAEAVITDLANFLDNYAQHNKEVSDPVYEAKYRDWVEVWNGQKKPQVKK